MQFLHVLQEFLLNGRLLRSFLLAHNPPAKNKSRKQNVYLQGPCVLRELPQEDYEPGGLPIGTTAMDCLVTLRQENTAV